jgi:hypothetical protein
LVVQAFRQRHPDARSIGLPAARAAVPLDDPTEAPVAPLDPILSQRVDPLAGWIRVLVILGVALAAMIVLTVVFGVTHPGPGYDILPDPAGALPF